MKPVIRLAVSIVAPTMDEFWKDAHEANRLLCAVEVDTDGKVKGILEARVDALKDANLSIKRLFSWWPDRETIVTPRHYSEASKDGMTDQFGFIGTEEDRKRIYEEALQHPRTKYIDIEGEQIDYFANLMRPRDVKPIISYHDFSSTPDSIMLGGVVQGLSEKGELIFGEGNYLVKFATKVNCEADNRSILSTAQEYSDGLGLVAVGFGNDLSKETRFEAPNYGIYLTFAGLDGKPASPGQPIVSELVDAWKARKYIK